MNHILAICDVQREYASKLGDYLNIKEGFPFQVRVFSTIEKLIEFAKLQIVEVALVSEEYEKILERRHLVSTIIIISPEGEGTQENSCKVYKYQSGEKILKKVLQIVASDNGKESHVVRSVSLKLIGLYSPIKRSLQTTFGLTMGQLLSKKSKVLYINLEGYSGLNTLLKQNFQRDLSDLLYYMQSGKKGLSYILGSMIETVNGLDILPPMLCQMDLISIEAKEWLRFFYELEKHSEYEYIIVDLSDSVQGLYELLRQCTVVYTVTERDGFAMAKMDQYERMLKQCHYEDVLEKTNKFELPRFSYLPKQLDRLTMSELADMVKECLKEDIYAVG